jgi:tetratricopeptide (TPR) repeat protein
MSDDVSRQQAMVLIERAQRHQGRGEFADAILLYRRSIAVLPTAEAFTHLGLTYYLMNRYPEAIDSCKLAIEIDSTYGNPYNAIGSCLIEQKQWEEAIPWLEKAIEAPRYQEKQDPHLNLGRVYEHLGQWRTALGHYDRALEIDPFSQPGVRAKFRLLGHLS